MPRPPRIDIPNSTHHIATLAVEREVVFREPEDRRRLLGHLSRVVETYEWRCRAYCLMGTHFHLIVYTPKANLSRGVQHLCGTYAQWFNWKYGRRGHLFARRFASRHIKADSHLLEAHRYVALNPVRAHLCQDPTRWPWGSYRALAGLEAGPHFLDVDGALEVFAGHAKSQHEVFQEFVLSSILNESADGESATAGV